MKMNNKVKIIRQNTPLTKIKHLHKLKNKKNDNRSKFNQKILQI